MIPDLSKTNDRPWVEKYLEDISCQSEIIQLLKNSIDNNSLPHLLFYGPPGTGKTSTILAFAKQLFGILELNASDDRGISVIREKVKTFAMVSVQGHAEGYPCPPIKFVILDEADSLTWDAQSALRRTMEIFSKNTRFCIICNYICRIIDPLTSRCAKFRFKPISQPEAIQKLKYISTAEGVTIDNSEIVLGHLISQAKGDMRRAITLLHGLHLMNQPITVHSIDNVIGNIPKETTSILLASCKNKSCTVETMYDILNIHVIQPGFLVLNLLACLAEAILIDIDFSEKSKAKLLLSIANSEFALTLGADETIQLLNVLVTIRDELIS